MKSNEVASAKKEVVKNARYLRDKDREIVRGIFRFHEVPGGTLSFSTKFHKDDPVEDWTLVDGQIHPLPLGVAKHLNKNVAYPIHGYMQGEDGKPLMKIHQKVRRCSFQSLEFMDSDDLMPAADSLITVETI